MRGPTPTGGGRSTRRRARPGRPAPAGPRPPPGGWVALLRGRHPAYITWDEYERNLARLRENQARADARGAVRPGPALLAGLLVCARCGRRLFVRYDARRRPAGDLRLQAGARTTTGARPANRSPGPPWSASSASRRWRRWRRPPWSCRSPRPRRWSASALTSSGCGSSGGSAPPSRPTAPAAGSGWRSQNTASSPASWSVSGRTPWPPSNGSRRGTRGSGTPPRGSPRRSATASAGWPADVPALWHAPDDDRRRAQGDPPPVGRAGGRGRGRGQRARRRHHPLGGGPADGRRGHPPGRPPRAVEHLCGPLRPRAAPWPPRGCRAAAIAARLNAEGFRPPKRREQFGRQGVADLLRQLGLRRPALPLGVAGRARAPRSGGSRNWPAPCRCPRSPSTPGCGGGGAGRRGPPASPAAPPVDPLGRRSRGRAAAARTPPGCHQRGGRRPGRRHAHE